MNAFNEYSDFRSGLDLHTHRTPFSGGSGSLPAAPGYVSWALAWAVLSLALAVVIGLYFVWLRGWPLALLGGLGVVLVVGYTPWINRFPLLCLLAPGVGFGAVIVMGSSIAVGGAVSSASVFAALLMAVLVSALLLANQQPDVDVDARFGRRHIAIVYGSAFARKLLALMWLLPLFILAAGLLNKGLPGVAVFTALPLLLAGYNAVRLLRLPLDSAMPTGLLASNVVVCLVTPLLLAILLRVA